MGNDFLRIYRPVLSSVMSIAIRRVSFGYKSRPDTPVGTPDHIPSSSLELSSSSSSSSSTAGLGFAESWDSVDARNVTKTKLITLRFELLSSVCIDSLAKFCILWFWPIKGFDTFRQCLLSHCWDLEVENGKNEPGKGRKHSDRSVSLLINMITLWTSHFCSEILAKSLKYTLYV